MIEADYIADGCDLVMGVDEVGRGPLAGPVVAALCAVKFQYRKDLFDLISYLKSLGVTDSKKISAKKRRQVLSALDIFLPFEFLKKEMFNLEIELVIDQITAQEIDELNILQASLRSMKNCTQKISFSGKKAILLIDGNKVVSKGELTLPSQQPIGQHPIVKGDQHSAIIALASIVAKEYRDQLMQELALSYPGYGFENHAGYPTSFHRQAIQQLGVSAIHRKTFKGVREYVR